MNHQEPVRVLQIIGKVCGGGVEAVIMNYYRHINRNKIQFDFVIDGYEQSELDDEINALNGKIYKVEPYSHNVFKYMYQIYQIIRENKYEIIHSNMNTLAVFSLFPAWLAGAKIRILHNHSTAVKSEKIRSLMKYILRPFSPLFANCYAACSQLAGEWMYGKKMMSNGNVKVINNAIDVKKFSFNSEKRKMLREKLGIKSDAFVVGHVGRFMYQKNHDFLIHIFRRVYEKNSNAVLILIGDGELRPIIEEKVNQYGLKSCVKFLGLRTDVNDLYNAMDVFVLPSWYEGLPVVAVEAQTNGLGCIFSNKVTKETILTSQAHFCKLENSIESWADRILGGDMKRNENATDEIAKNGFDIIVNSKLLENWYLEQYKKVEI